MNTNVPRVSPRIVPLGKVNLRECQRAGYLGLENTRKSDQLVKLLTIREEEMSFDAISHFVVKYSEYSIIPVFAFFLKSVL